ncbi:hypothetical protein ACIQWA_30885 [Kitasatospora sp. NPDC098652]|uniref:hypothetical protein n=1 Tax=Kitasatospora sp. NPDC098652 TaxID=3364095 RepID=UPI003813DC71
MIRPNLLQPNLKTGHDREVLAVYPYRSACPRSVWAQLIAEARSEVFLAGYTNYFAWLEQPELLQTLRRKVESGCRIRFLLGDPDSDTTREREQIEGLWSRGRDIRTAPLDA